MPQVDSSAIRDIDYTPSRRRLHVRFVSGAVYGYEGVPAPIGEAFLAAGSKGRYFARRIRDRFPYRRLP
jgi:hypothetical protein